MKKPWLKFAIFFALSLALLYFFLRGVDLGDVLRNLMDVNPIFFILMIVLVPLHLLTRAVRWQYLLKHEKEKTSLYNRFAANAVGFTVTMVFPGRLGEIVKPLYLARKENMRKGFVVGTAVVERIFDILTMCAILGLFLISKPLYATLFHIDEEIYSRLIFWGIFGIVFASAILTMTLCLYFFRDKTLRFITFFLKPLPKHIKHKIMELVDEFIAGLKFFHSIKNLMVYILLSFVVWLGIIFYYWICFYAYNISVTYFFLFPYVFMLMVGASIPTPGMVGGFHFFSKLGLTSFYGVNENLATSITVVIHGVQVIVTCLIGYAILWREGVSLLQVSKIGEDTDQ